MWTVCKQNICTQFYKPFSVLNGRIIQTVWNFFGIIHSLDLVYHPAFKIKNKRQQFGDIIGVTMSRYFLYSFALGWGLIVSPEQCVRIFILTA